MQTLGFNLNFKYKELYCDCKREEKNSLIYIHLTSNKL